MSIHMENIVTSIFLLMESTFPNTVSWSVCFSWEGGQRAMFLDEYMGDNQSS